MAYEQPSPVNLIGDITLHGREGVILEFAFQNAVGDFVNISDTELWFEVKGVLRTELTAGPTDYRRLITITQAHTVAINAAGAKFGRTLPFVVRDETADPPSVLWMGNITTVGFTEQPE